MKTVLRLAAIAAASTALVAGGAITTAATAAPGDGIGATIAIQPGFTSGYPRSATTQVATGITSTTPGVTYSSLRATVTLNGVPVNTNVFVSPGSGFTYQRAWGIGVVALTNVVASGTDTRPGSSGTFFNKPVAVAPNGAQVSYGLDYRTEVQVRKRGKKLTFKVKARYIDNTGKPVRVSKATVQVKKGSKWKTLKKVKLKSNGTATFKKSDKKKRTYRLVIPQTGTHQGATLKLERKI